MADCGLVDVCRKLTLYFGHATTPFSGRQSNFKEYGAALGLFYTECLLWTLLWILLAIHHRIASHGRRRMTEDDLHHVVKQTNDLSSVSTERNFKIIRIVLSRCKISKAQWCAKQVPFISCPSSKCYLISNKSISILWRCTWVGWFITRSKPRLPTVFLRFLAIYWIRTYTVCHAHNVQFWNWNKVQIYTASYVAIVLGPPL